MKRIITMLLLGYSILVSSCSNSDAAAKSNADKKAKLEQLKSQKADVDKQITALEADLSKTDSTFIKPEKTKLVTIASLAPVSFTHYIDLQGQVDADNISYIAPRGAPGVATAVLVKKGDRVRKGQTLLKLNDVVQRQQLTAAQTQLGFAKDLYQRRKNLWDQKIGAEVDLITAKNNVDQAESQVKLAQEQLNFTNVVADIDGVVDDITVKVGETFAGGQQLRLLNTNSLKAVAQVPEVYLDKVRVGTPVKVVIPELNNRIIETRIRVAGKLIDPGSRTFYVEAKLPYDKDLRPNQLALTKIQDYTTASALTIPVNTLQTDDKGKYLMVAVQENGRLVARKRAITVGQLYQDKIEVKTGLNTGDNIIVEGYQNLYEGQPITTKAS